jgi:hypothetical protein
MASATRRGSGCCDIISNNVPRTLKPCSCPVWHLRHFGFSATAFLRLIDQCAEFVELSMPFLAVSSRSKSSFASGVSIVFAAIGDAGDLRPAWDCMPSTLLAEPDRGVAGDYGGSVRGGHREPAWVCQNHSTKSMLSELRTRKSWRKLGKVTTPRIQSFFFPGGEGNYFLPADRTPAELPTQLKGCGSPRRGR